VKPTIDAASATALEALAYLAEDATRLSRFLSTTGIEPSALRDAAGAPQTLLAVLEHILADESLLLVFSAGKGIDPAGLEPARDVLERAILSGAVT
jgi:hypothetical protein